MERILPYGVDTRGYWKCPDRADGLWLDSGG
jgi:hypothetical protein